MLGDKNTQAEFKILPFLYGCWASSWLDWPQILEDTCDVWQFGIKSVAIKYYALEYCFQLFLLCLYGPFLPHWYLLIDQSNDKFWDCQLILIQKDLFPILQRNSWSSIVLFALHLESLGMELHWLIFLYIIFQEHQSICVNKNIIVCKMKLNRTNINRLLWAKIKMKITFYSKGCNIQMILLQY